MPTNAKAVELARLLADAVQAEQRFGNRQDTRAQLDQKWERIAELIAGLKRAK